MSSTRAIREIHVRARHRRDLGDLADLKASMEAIGLLHPIVITEKNRLIAGERRLRAARELGWINVPIRVVRNLEEAADALRAERDENTCRKDFLPSEAVALARDLEPFERKAAKERQREAGKVHGRGKVPPIGRKLSEAEAREKIAIAVGVPRTTLAKASAIVAAAEREPEKFERLRDQMDRTGNVHGAFKQLEKQKQAALIAAEPPPLPTGPFRVIVADPPWKYDTRADDVTHRSNLPYPEMSIEAICALPVRPLAAEDSVLWLWTTNAHMRESFTVLDAWGFESNTILTWAKQKFGAGHWLRGQTEHCHLAIRGKPTVLLTNQTTLLSASAGAHSEKPDAFYTLVEALCPGSKVELFARRPREGFVAHGNAVQRTA
jgi:N6-adenosine-specific RNA methylase IME4/ParB-like chromosome segregation protein Spo0J